MNKIVRKLLRYLMAEFCAVWLLAIITYVLGEAGIIPNGIMADADNPAAGVYINTAVILLTLVCVPLSLKLFSLNTSRGLRRMNKDEALASYHLWSLVRLGMLWLCAEAGLVAYYLLMDTTGLLCACISMVMTLLCIPSMEKVNEFLSANEEERAENIQ